MQYILAPGENKLDDRDAVSGPRECSGTVSLPQFDHPHRSVPGNPNSLTLDGQTQTQGILLLQNKPICDDGWAMAAAHVACRQLGFSRALHATRAHRGGGQEFSINKVKCRGNETSLQSCSHETTDVCVHGEAAGIQCDTMETRDINMMVETLKEECLASKVLFGPERSPEVWMLPTLLDCQELCGRTVETEELPACNTFSYDTKTTECRLHQVGEMEDKGRPPPSGVTTPRPLRTYIEVGDRVRVKASVDVPTHAWGSATHASVGIVTQLDPMRVDFPEQGGWRAEMDEMERVFGDGLTPDLAPSECPEGWTKLATGCYMFPVRDGAKNWFESKAVCEEAGGYFVEVNSHREQNAISSHIQSRAISSQISSYRFWIGYSDNQTEGVWVWTSGKTGDFTNWDGSPDNSGDRGYNADCAYLANNGNHWGDERCEYSRAYSKNFYPICEIDNDPTKAVNKEYLNENSTVISGPASCNFSQIDTSSCRYESSLCLSGGSNPREGSVFFQGKPLCDDMWGPKQAALVCNDLGYGKAKNFTTNSRFGTLKGPLSEVYCPHNAEEFANCTVTNQLTCLGEEVAGVICETEDEKMRREEEEDRLNQCFVTGVEYITSSISLGQSPTAMDCQQLCRADEHCTHFFFDGASLQCYPATGMAKREKVGVVSGPQSCDPVATAMEVTDSWCLLQGNLCLGGQGRSPSRRRTEGNVFVGGKPVCDDGWNLVSAEVACRQLQHWGVERITQGSHFGYTSGHFGMDNVGCHGNETSLEDCPGSPTEDCYGGEAAGVVCDTRSNATIMAERRKIAECFVEDVMYWGAAINATMPNTTSSLECQEHCARTNCTHFTFWPTVIAKNFQDCSEICLQGGSGPHEGNVIVNNKPVCDDVWKSVHGQVVCRQLGFSGLIETTKKSKFGSHGSVFSMDQVQCSGSEETLQSCRYDRHDDCGAGEAAGVVCVELQSNPDMLCQLYSGAELGRNKSSAAGAITGPRTCDVELVPICTEDLCLNGGQGDHEGNVFYKGAPVCDDGFNFLAASTVCKELGFTRAKEVTNSSHFGMVPRKFSMDDVQCIGTEETLSNCTFSDVENCDGSEGAGVICETRSTEVVNAENLKVEEQCFSDSVIDTSDPSLLINIRPGFIDYPVDDAVSCQLLCSSTDACQYFFFELENKRCSLVKTIGSGRKVKPRGASFLAGPRTCYTTPPNLQSYKGEDCSLPGVACVSGGRGPWEGLVHIGGPPVCNDNWDNADAKVVCKQMGYRTGRASLIDQHLYPVAGPFGMSQVQCQGSEASLQACTHEAAVKNCLYNEGARVTCEQFNERPLTSSPSPPSCAGDCSIICLKGGSTCNEGNVFVRNEPVCDDEWGWNDAEVVCRQLGFSGAVEYTRENQFGPIGTGRFIMDNVGCSGGETDILTCPHASRDDCDSNEGAGVVCVPATPPPTTTPAPAPPSCTPSIHSGQWAFSGTDEQFHMRNILTDSCDLMSMYPHLANYWLAPSNSSVAITLDLGCTQVVDSIKLRNTRNGHVNDRGLERFQIAISNSSSGPWHDLLSDSLPDARGPGPVCHVPLTTFKLAEDMTEKARTGRWLKLEVVSWYGHGAGLQYLAIHSHPPSGITTTVVAVLFTLIILASLAAFVWAKRDTIKSSCTQKVDRDIREKNLKRVYKSQQSEQALIITPIEEE